MTEMPKQVRHDQQINKKNSVMLNLFQHLQKSQMVRLTKAFIYILSNKTRTTFYIGVTNNLERRISEHKNLEGSSFAVKYKLTELVYYEIISDIEAAIKREKQLKNWHRQWKINLIKELNPEMTDLAKDW